MKIRSAAALSICLSLFAVVACGKSTSSAVGTTQIRSETLSTTVTGLGKECKDGFECPSTGGEGCDWECAQTKIDGPKSCVLLSKGGGVGSTGCYGNTFHNETIWRTGKMGDAKRGVLCDVDQGARCDEATHACVKVSAIGEACSDVVDCGKNGDCKSGKCVAGAAIGASCKDLKCADGAACKYPAEKCVARAKNGGKCSENDDCESRACVGGSCGERAATPACTL